MPKTGNDTSTPRHRNSGLNWLLPSFDQVAAKSPDTRHRVGASITVASAGWLPRKELASPYVYSSINVLFLTRSFQWTANEPNTSMNTT